MNARNKLIIILLIALVLRLLLLIYFWDKPLKIVDEYQYQAIAENILLFNEFSYETGDPTSMRPPLYPAFLSAIYSITGGININAVRILQTLLAMGSVCMVYLLGKKIFNEKAGVAASAMFAMYPSFLFFTHLILTEVLFTMLFLLFVWFILSFMENRRYRDIFLAGLFLGLSALTRSILYPFIAVAGIFVLITCRGTLKQTVVWMVLLAAGYALVIGPWAVRNTMLQRDLVVIGTMGGLNLYMGNYEHTPLNSAWATVNLKGEKAWYYGHEDTLSRMTEAQKQKWAVKKAKKYMVDNKLLTLKRIMVKAANFWGLERTIIGGIIGGYYPEFRPAFSLIIITLIIFSAYALVFVGALFGLAYNFRLARHDIIFIILLTGYFTGMHALVFGHSRYHLPLISLLVVFASWSLLKIKDIWKNRKTWSFGFSVMMTFLLIIIWVREIVFIEGARYLIRFNF